MQIVFVEWNDISLRTWEYLLPEKAQPSINGNKGYRPLSIRI